MDTTVENLFATEKLFADLKKVPQEANITADLIKNAKKGDGASLYTIGCRYHHSLKQYHKALAWYRLAANKNYPSAQNKIGLLYENGEGVPIDYDIAMEWYLTAARQGSKMALKNIGILFESGRGVQCDKIKTLEWYYKYSSKCTRIDHFLSQGMHLTDEMKNKTITQLINETEYIVRVERGKRVREMDLEFAKLQFIKISMEDENNSKNEKIEHLESERQSLRNTLEQKHQEVERKQEAIEHSKKEILELLDKLKSIEKEKNSLKSVVIAKGTEIYSLKDRIKSLGLSTDEKEIERMVKKIAEIEQSNKNLSKLLEQERQIKNNEIKLIKQNAETLIRLEMEKKKDLEKENKALKMELGILKKC